MLENPQTGKTEKRLDMAKYVIDSLDLLKEKTKGNLTESEERFINAIIADLKLAYVRAKNEDNTQSTSRTKSEG